MKTAHTGQMPETITNDMPGAATSPFLKRINLPAGSGKTTSIGNELREYCRENLDNRVLAITYTNRAAKELSARLHTESQVRISTIHSFINEELSDLFHCSPVIAQYFDWKKTDIKNYLANEKHQQPIERYKEKYGTATYDAIRKNTRYLKYSKKNAGSRLYGTLGHDELLEFFVILVKKFRCLRERIGTKYQRIIIDEYQDTNPDVLDVLACIADEFRVPLFIYGDRMQQIFNKNEHKLNVVLQRFSPVSKPIVNYRSQPAIVHMLNKLYNDSDYLQVSPCEAKHRQKERQSTLKVIIDGNPMETAREIQKKAHDTPLALVVFNKDRFRASNLETLYEKYHDSKKYGPNKEYNLTNVLLPDPGETSPDDIDAYMLKLIEIRRILNQHDRNAAFRAAVEGSTAHLFDSPVYRHGRGDTPLRLQQLNIYIDDLDQLTQKVAAGDTVQEVLQFADVKNLINDSWYRALMDGDPVYEQLKTVTCEQFIRQYELIDDSANRHVSTQHGVKGESHDSIIFVAQDSPRWEPRLSMYDCIELLCRTDDCNLDHLIHLQESLYNLAQQHWKDATTNPIDTQKAFLDAYSTHPDICIAFAKEVEHLFSKDSSTDQMLYKRFIGPVIDGFLNATQSSKTCTAASLKPMGNLGTVIPRITAAFRLLYVGCSRARRNLFIVLDAQEINQHFPSNRECLITAFSNLGFAIEQRDKENSLS